MSAKEVVHWEHKGKLLCGASLDVIDDRFLVDPRWVKHVNCEACISVMRTDPSVVPPPASAGPEPIDLPGPPLTRAEYRERAERISPTPRSEDTAGPDPMPEGWPDPKCLINVGASSGPYWVRYDLLRTLLATQGYHLWKAGVEDLEDVPLSKAADESLIAEANTRGLAIVPAADVPTAEERRVLAACAGAPLNDDDPDLCESEPLEPQEHGEDCYLYTDDQYAIAKAELARRAAKGRT